MGMASGASGGTLARMLVAAAGIGIIGVIGGGMSGCWTYRKGDPARLSREPVAVQPGDWPLRTTEVLENLAAKTPKEIRRFELAPGAKLKDVQDAKMREAITKPDTTVVHQGVYGKCLLRVFGEMVRSSDKQRDQQIRAQEKKWTGFESNARTLTSRTISNPIIWMRSPAKRSLATALARASEMRGGASSRELIIVCARAFVTSGASFCRFASAATFYSVLFAAAAAA